MESRIPIIHVAGKKEGHNTFGGDANNINSRIELVHQAVASAVSDGAVVS